MSTLQASVGAKGINLREDVLAVQRLLKAKGIDPGPVDGICGAKTVTAIQKFQATFMAKPDGLISPNQGRPVGSTWLGPAT